MKIATWNVNSIKQRLPNLLEWLKEATADVVLLQELKVPEESFPDMEIGDAGYNTAVWGQSAYNGVAILSKQPIHDVKRGLPGDSDDDHARYIEAEIAGIRVASLYLPNGNPVDSDKFPYKLKWMERLTDRAAELIAAEEPFVLAGDYNLCPEDADVYSVAAFAEDALCRPESRARFRELTYLGLTDAFRALHPTEPNAYTYWSYQAGAHRKGQGVRIDHILLSPALADRLVACDIDRKPRAQTKASDHTPIWCELGPEPQPW